MAMAIFMEYKELLIQFPVNPEELKINKEANNETIEVVKLGEISVAKDMKLATLSFDSFLPADNVYPFILTKNKFEKPEFYINFLESRMKNKEPVRFILSDSKINMLALINKFEWGYKAGTQDVYFTLDIVEFREVRVKEVKISDYADKRPVQQTNTRPTTNSSSKSVTPGCNVLVNGRLHRDSYGKGPGMTLKNYKGKVNYIQKGRSHPYHVTQPNGAWLGWVIPSAIQVL